MKMVLKSIARAAPKRLRWLYIQFVTATLLHSLMMQSTWNKQNYIDRTKSYASLIPLVNNSYKYPPMLLTSE